MATLVQQTTSANTPAILTSAGTALASNKERIGWSIQNLGTNPLFILLGAGASSTVFHMVLKGGSATDDGLGASMGETAGTIYTGIITVAGTSPRFTVLEHGTAAGTLTP